MGNACCQDENVRRDVTEALESRVGQRSFSQEFYEAELPSDPLLLARVAAIRQDETFALVLDSHRPMKHKFLDKYYQGKWNDRGEPEGLGLMFEPDHYLYHGEFHLLPSGTGSLLLIKDQLLYEGHLHDGRAEGQGRLRSLDGRLQFEGEMRNSLPRAGQLRISNPADASKSYTVTLMDFPEGPSRIAYADGRTYEGNVSRRTFAPQGRGTAYFPDGSTYEGEWEEGEMHGQGVFQWADGTTYAGDYQHGRKHGEGTFTYLSKKRYVGEWAAGRQHGKGRLLDPNGKLLKEGAWKDGALQ